MLAGGSSGSSCAVVPVRDATDRQTPWLMEKTERTDGPTRRDFLRATGAVALGAGAVAVPGGVGLAVFLEPLRRSGAAANWVRVAPLSALPADGTPRRFAVHADRVNAWNREPDAPVGAVFLRRTGETSVQAFNVICPHAGCPVTLAPDGEPGFLCPCHRSTFGPDGSVNDPASPAPRGLDTLEVETRDGREVWVRFQNFIPGRKEKTPA